MFNQQGLTVGFFSLLYQHHHSTLFLEIFACGEERLEEVSVWQALGASPATGGQVIFLHLLTS